MITIEKIDKNIVPKKWGYEIILHNRLDYCGKILHFHKGGKFSMHFHILKSETFYVNEGQFQLNYIDPQTADRKCMMLEKGNIIEIEKGNPHQLVALTEGEIFEASTMHHEFDSYRIEKGDSQS